MPETQVQSLGQEDPLEKEMAIHSSILAWKTPCTEEPGRATVARVGYDLEAKPPPNMNDLNPNFCVVCQCFQSPFTSQRSQEIAMRKESHLTEKLTRD